MDQRSGSPANYTLMRRIINERQNEWKWISQTVQLGLLSWWWTQAKYSSSGGHRTDKKMSKMPSVSVTLWKWAAERERERERKINKFRNGSKRQRPVFVGQGKKYSSRSNGVQQQHGWIVQKMKLTDLDGTHTHTHTPVTRVCTSRHFSFYVAVKVMNF